MTSILAGAPTAPTWPGAHSVPCGGTLLRPQLLQADHWRAAARTAARRGPARARAAGPVSVELGGYESDS